jgi:uncharacterized repeat protein (TIGR01451 family)
MNKFSKITVTSASSIILAASIVSPAFAWHPKGEIVKSVQNVTSGSALSDANDASTAVAAKPGDTLKYVITVKNAGDPDDSGNNDMAKTTMKDTLPAGVELTSDASQRTISEDLGTIKPGKSVTKEYTVKVTATTDGIIENKACFTGDSKANDNPQNGCDSANVKVTVPPTPVTPPVTPVTPVTPTTPTMPTTLPNTGPGQMVAVAAAAAAIGYAGYLLRIKRSARANG